MLSIRSLLIFLAGLIATVSAGTNQEGLAFLKAKETEEGVVKLESGLLYKELRPGNGSTKKAKINTPCKCHYAGTLIDGTEFDSSYKRGAVSWGHSTWLRLRLHTKLSHNIACFFLLLIILVAPHVRAKPSHQRLDRKSTVDGRRSKVGALHPK